MPILLRFSSRIPSALCRKASSGKVGHYVESHSRVVDCIVRQSAFAIAIAIAIAMPLGAAAGSAELALERCRREQNSSDAADRLEI